MNRRFEDKKNTLFLVLAGVFITNALLAEILGSKLFSVEKIFGFAPVNFKFFGEYVLDFNLTAGVVLWPVVFITTDIINEYFGKRGVRKITILTVSLVAFAFAVIYAITELPPADFWIEVNSHDAAGNPLDIQSAFKTVYTQGLNIIVASLIAFVVSQFLDVFIFQRLRKITGSKHLWMRATLSTLVSQLIDSYVVLIIAFYWLGNWPLHLVLAVGVMNYIYKFIVAIAMTPVIYLAHYSIDTYLGKDHADRLAEQATK